MYKESLEEALDVIIQSICNLNINQSDKVELLINLKHFLDVNRYQRNIELLSEDFYINNKCNKLRN